MSESSPTLDDVRRALSLTGFDHEAAWRRMVPRRRALRRAKDLPGEARIAEVLLLLYPRDGGLCFVLTQRTETVATHKGQISLPGGGREPSDKKPGDAALREACEELAICEPVDLVGTLAPLYIGVSDFEIYPYVGYTARPPVFRPEPAEVAGVIEMPLRALLDDAIKAEERWNLHGFEMDVPFYRLGESVIWGATAIMLSEFEQRLRAALNGR